MAVPYSTAMYQAELNLEVFVERSGTASIADSKNKTTSLIYDEPMEISLICLSQFWEYAEILPDRLSGAAFLYPASVLTTQYPKHAHLYAMGKLPPPLFSLYFSISLHTSLSDSLFGIILILC